MLKSSISFSNLGLNTAIVSMLKNVGYLKPLPIQIKCIPLLLRGCDLLGMAHTGSGKTAAFLLPLLQNIDLKRSIVQGLIITPTRELAIQISQVCADFAKCIKEIGIATLYGGQNYYIQLNALKKSPHIIIGTPGRLLDHIRRGTVNISKLKTLVIDEADEMLRMGFIEDIEYIITQVPKERQTALFSATLPMHIKKISCKFMCNPQEVYINDNNIRIGIKQSYCIVNGIKKSDVLIRFLETEDFDAVIVFVRTKYATLQIAKILDSQGYNSAALNGDMDQLIRDQTVSRLRCGALDILITTDVAARGLDIHRVSLVINYDVPISYNVYVHRIGRTGRAGNTGKSLLFVEHQEYKLLHIIKRKVCSNISEISYPTSNEVMNCRLIKFVNKITDCLHSKDIEVYRSLLFKIKSQKKLSIEDLAVVLLKIAQGNRPLILPQDRIIKNKKAFRKKIYKDKDYVNYRKDNLMYIDHPKIGNISINNDVDSDFVNIYRISIGYNHGITKQHIIKAILNRINLCYYDIGNIQLFSSYSVIEILKQKSCNKKIIFPLLSSIKILNKKINIRRIKNISGNNLVLHS